MKSFLCLVFALAVPLAYAQITDHPVGEIKGVVIDQGGDPVAGATVYVAPQDISFDDVSPRSVQSDKKGEFDFHGGLALGNYKVYARKEQADYPDRSDVFYADSLVDSPELELTEENPFASVTVTMGEKAGVLQGRVMDAETGADTKAKLVFIDPEGNDHSVIADGKYRVLLPADKDISLMVMPMSPDYRSQTMPAVRLDAGEMKHLNIPVHKD